jgi:tetratricopeptide (TPR) repeat protein
MNRIAEIFGILQESDPDEAVSQRITLSREALGLMTADEAARETGGWLQFELGKAYLRRQTTDPVQDLSAAIEAFTAALGTWTPASQPENWVAALENLGVAYSERHRLTGDHEDMVRSLNASKEALAAVELGSDPVTWAALKNSIGLLYLQRTDGDRTAILEEALESLQEAAQVRGQLRLLGPWVQSQGNLGLAYRERAAGVRSENLENSLECLDAALRTVAEVAAASGGVGEVVNNKDLAIIHMERSETLLVRIAGTWADNVELAYASAQQAVDLVQPEEDPLTWSDAQAGLGNTLRRRTVGGYAENLEAAITCYRLALSRHNRDTAPLKWALRSRDLGGALTERIRGQRITNTEEAREHLEGAVAVLKGIDGLVVIYAAVLSELGNVYLRRRRGSVTDNAENAWRCLSEARQLMERLSMPPLTRAGVLDHLGNACMARVAGNREQHLEDAIECYEHALALAGPEDGQLQARLLNNLASAYAQRVRSDRDGNVEHALRLYEQVNSFRTREASPLDWAQTRNNIGTVLAQKLDPADTAAPELWEQAAAAFRDALAVLLVGGPTASVVTVGRNLGQLGATTHRWDDAVDGYQAALDAANARYRESLLLEARYDELTDMAGLPAELAAALGSAAADGSSEAADADELLRRAVTVVENGRMQMLGELTERDRSLLVKLQDEHPDLYQSYLTRSERLREYENNQWREFQQLQPSGQINPFTPNGPS